MLKAYVVLVCLCLSVTFFFVLSLLWTFERFEHLVLFVCCKTRVLWLDMVVCWEWVKSETVRSEGRDLGTLTAVQGAAGCLGLWDWPMTWSCSTLHCCRTDCRAAGVGRWVVTARHITAVTAALTNLRGVQFSLCLHSTQCTTVIGDRDTSLDEDYLNSAVAGGSV